MCHVHVIKITLSTHAI